MADRFPSKIKPACAFTKSSDSYKARLVCTPIKSKFSYLLRTSLIRSTSASSIGTLFSQGSGATDMRVNKSH